MTTDLIAHIVDLLGCPWPESVRRVRGAYQAGFLVRDRDWLGGYDPNWIDDAPRDADGMPMDCRFVRRVVPLKQLRWADGSCEWAAYDDVTRTLAVREG